MKICLVHRHYPPVGGGGICTYIATLAHGLVDAGHTVHVIARAETGPDRVEQDRGVTIHRLAPLSSNRLMNIGLTGMGHLIRKVSGKFVNRLWAGRRIAAKVEELTLRGEIELVETAEWEAELYWYLKNSNERIPTVVKLHGPMEIIRSVNRMKRDPAFDCLANWERRMTLMADQVTCPSLHLAEEMSRRWGMEIDQIEIIPYPVDDRQFSPKEEASKFEPQTILFVGRIEKNKGADVLFASIPKILERFPRAKFRLIGSDTQTGEGGGSFQQQLLRGLPDLYHAQVEMVGPRSHGELVSVYQQATVFVIPSLFDNFPNACLEAMACGCAVLGSDTGGIREMIEDKHSGRLFPVGDSNSLAETLIEMLSTPESIEHYGKMARQRVENEYSMERVLNKTMDYYERTVGVKKS